MSVTVHTSKPRKCEQKVPAAIFYPKETTLINPELFDDETAPLFLMLN